LKVERKARYRQLLPEFPILEYTDGYFQLKEANITHLADGSWTVLKGDRGGGAASVVESVHLTIAEQMA
jgi:hypothetical protein